MKFLLLLLISCSSIPKKNSRAPVGGWKEVFETSIKTDLKDPSRWTVKENVISFTGNLVKGDCDKFKALLTPETKTLAVRSQGGLVNEGLCIAEAMKDNNFEKTIVGGVCFSSCANYLFLGSPERIIQSGLVGFHGNMNALVKLNPEMVAKKNPYRAKFVSEMDQDVQRVRAVVRHLPDSWACLSGLA